jgi:hypothetical protein
MEIFMMVKCNFYIFFKITLFSRIGTQVREGRGVLVKRDGALYEGWFRNNKFHGRGRVISA